MTNPCEELKDANYESFSISLIKNEIKEEGGGRKPYGPNMMLGFRRRGGLLQSGPRLRIDPQEPETKP